MIGGGLGWPNARPTSILGLSMRLKTVPLSSRSTHALVSITPNFSLLYLFYYYDSCDPVLLQLASEHFRSLMFLCVFYLVHLCPGHDKPVSGSPGRDPKYIHRVRRDRETPRPASAGGGSTSAFSFPQAALSRDLSILRGYLLCCAARVSLVLGIPGAGTEAK